MDKGGVFHSSAIHFRRQLTPAGSNIYRKFQPNTSSDPRGVEYFHEKNIDPDYRLLAVSFAFLKKKNCDLLKLQRCDPVWVGNAIEHIICYKHANPSDSKTHISSHRGEDSIKNLFRNLLIRPRPRRSQIFIKKQSYDG